MSRSTKDNDETPGSPEPELITAIGTALLLRGHEASGPFGRISYCEPALPQERATWLEQSTGEDDWK